MNQHLAIAAVTQTLRNLLIRGRNGTPNLGNAQVFHRPPGQVPDPDAAGAVNLFLYATSVSGAWRNTDLPDRVKPGESGHSPLALNLHYLLTAYANDATAPQSHELLGTAMSILHDSPLLNADEIKYDRNNADYTHRQVERVRITPHPLSLDEMTKLWSTFQQDYRTSTAYEVAVLLIASSRSTKTAPPVRRRGREDSDGSGGTLPETPERIGTHGSPQPPYPTILAIEPAGGQPSLELGTTLVIRGHGLSSGAGETIEVQFTNSYQSDNDQPASVVVPPENQSDSQLKVELPADLSYPRFNAAGQPLRDAARNLVTAPVPPGLARIAVAYTNGSGATRQVVRSTSQQPVSIAPKVVTEEQSGLPGGVPQIAGQLMDVTTIGGTQRRVVIAVRCNPPVRTNQQEIALLFGSTAVPFDPDLTAQFPGDQPLEVTGSYEFNGQQASVQISTPLPIPDTSNVLVFIVDRQPPLNELVRLRIDGIDSLLIADRTVHPPQFRDTRVIIPAPSS